MLIGGGPRLGAVGDAPSGVLSAQGGQGAGGYGLGFEPPYLVDGAHDCIPNHQAARPGQGREGDGAIDRLACCGQQGLGIGGRCMLILKAFEAKA